MIEFNGIEVTQKINKISNYKFEVFWDYWQLKRQRLILDFQPLVTAFKLTAPFVLIHWQARPKYLRRWGAFNGQTQEYFSFQCFRCQISPNIKTQLLQISEQDFPVVPTAVVCYKNAKIEQILPSEYRIISTS